MNSNKFSPLTGPSGPSFRAKIFLFDHVIGSYIPKDFSMHSNKFSPLTGLETILIAYISGYYISNAY